MVGEVRGSDRGVSTGRPRLARAWRARKRPSWHSAGREHDGIDDRHLAAARFRKDEAQVAVAYAAHRVSVRQRVVDDLRELDLPIGADFESHHDATLDL